MKKDSLRGMPALLLCEGIDEKNFLIAYINYLLIFDPVFDNIEILNYGGINDLNNYLRTISQQDKFENVKSIAIIRDAETDWSAAVQSLESSINNSGINRRLFSDMPYYLFPMQGDTGNWQNGTLEDLCLSILNLNSDHAFVNENTVRLSQLYIKNLENENFDTFPRRHKNLLHSYFSGTNNFVDLKIGEAARAGAFDWCHQNLLQLSNFLRILVQKCVN